MTLLSRSLLLLVAVASLTLFGLGQTPPGAQTPAPTGPLLKSNPKISQPDFEAAQAETLAAGGDKAELIYAARIDAVEQGRYDCLIVIYTKPARGGADYFAEVVREGQKYPLVFDKQDKLGRAFKPGDKFLQIGLKHEEGKPALLRLMSTTVDKEKGRQKRNLDFQFNGTEFAQVGQSMMPLPK